MTTFLLGLDFGRLTWTPLMSATWTVSSSFRRSMLASLKHRYVDIRGWTSVPGGCRLVVSPVWADAVGSNTLKYSTCASPICTTAVCTFLAQSVALFCLFCRWPRRAPYSFVPLQISLPTMTASWSEFLSVSCSFKKKTTHLINSSLRLRCRLWQ